MRLEGVFPVLGVIVKRVRRISILLGLFGDFFLDFAWSDVSFLGFGYLRLTVICSCQPEDVVGDAVGE